MTPFFSRDENSVQNLGQNFLLRILKRNNVEIREHSSPAFESRNLKMTKLSQLNN